MSETAESIAACSEPAPRPPLRLPRLRWDDWCVAALLALAVVNIFWQLRAEFGWDTAVYCAATAAFQKGLDPYLISNLGGIKLSFVYQPVFLHVIAPVCDLPRFMPAPFTFLSLAATMAAICLWPGTESRSGALLAVALTLGGFAGLAWTLKTGNISALELLLLSVAIVAMRGGRWRVAAVVLGALASLKLLTIVLLMVVLVADGSWKRRLGLLMLGGGVFAAIAIASAALHPDYMLTFLRLLIGGIDGQHSPITEYGSQSNPAVIFLLAAATGVADYGPMNVLLYVLAFAAVAGATAMVVLRRENGVPDVDARIGFALLILILFMPRLKPYSLLLASAPLWLLARRLPPPGRVAVAVPVLAVPTLWGLFNEFGIHTFWWNYQQPLTLAIALALLLVFGVPAGRSRQAPEMDAARASAG